MSVQELDVVVAFLNVGHGEASIIRFREGHEARTIVIDGGGPDHSRVLLSYLLHNMVTTIHLLVATHIDRNHVAGLIPVVESDRITIHSFWGPSCEFTQPSVAGLRTSDERAYQRLYSRITQRVQPERIVCPTRGVPLPRLFTEPTIAVLNPTRANVLKPTPKNTPTKNPSELALEQNELALVLYFECHGLSVLLTSDVEGPFWSTMLGDASLQRYLDVDILKVPNYGRASGLPAALATYIRTECAVFSLGAETDHQPSAEVLSLIQGLRAEVICTEHAKKNSFCRNGHCPAASGGQNIVFCHRKGDTSLSPSADFCPLHTVAKPPPE